MPVISEPIDYEKLLAAWIEEREALDLMIDWARKKLGKETAKAPTARIRLDNPLPSVPSALPSDSFFRMTVPQAIKTFLNMVKRPRTAKQITEALDLGGLTHQAKNLYATVYPTLLRMEKNEEVVRVSNGEWALAEWYANSSRKSSQGEKAESGS